MVANGFFPAAKFLGLWGTHGTDSMAPYSRWGTWVWSGYETNLADGGGPGLIGKVWDGMGPIREVQSWLGHQRAD